MCGQIFRRMGPMLQKEGASSSACQQTYFHDAKYQAVYLARRNSPSSLPAWEMRLRVNISEKL